VAYGLLDLRRYPCPGNRLGLAMVLRAADLRLVEDHSFDKPFSPFW
jgi:hypothetical protein